MMKKVSGDVGILRNTDPFPYETPSATGPMNNDILSQLIKTIDKLPREDHEEIYMLLRRHKQEGFFAVNGMGTHFNIDGLSDQIKWNLHNLVMLSLANSERNRYLQQATTEHTNIMSKQYNTMVDHGTPVLPTLGELRNPSEDDKTHYMMEMNLNQNKLGIRRNLVI